MNPAKQYFLQAILNRLVIFDHTAQGLLQIIMVKKKKKAVKLNFILENIFLLYDFTVLLTNIVTLGKYEQRQLWK